MSIFFKPEQQDKFNLQTVHVPPNYRLRIIPMSAMVTYEDGGIEYVDTTEYNIKQSSIPLLLFADFIGGNVSPIELKDNQETNF